MTYVIEDFVDREEQLAALWESVRQETGKRLLLVRGIEGIGKTYLLDEFRAECQAKGVACAQLHFPKGGKQDYMAIVLGTWDQLGLGSFEDLAQLIASPSTIDARRATPTSPGAPGEHRDAVGRDMSQAAPNRETGGDVIEAQFGDIGDGAQVAFGKQIEIYKVFNLTVQRDDRLVQDMIRDRTTAAFRERLIDLTTGRKVVFLLDPWERIEETETGEWLCGNLLNWILGGELPNAVAVVAGLEAPDLHRLPRRIGWFQLEELPDEAIRTYWVKKCGLPSADLPNVIEICGGLPRAMVLAVELYFQGGGVPSIRGEQGADAQSKQAIVEHLIEGLLAAIPPQVAEAVRLGAIPHWCNAELLGRLCGPKVDVGQAMSRLRRFRFVEQVEQGFEYPDQVRDYLLAQWQRERLPEYKAANRSVLDYFRALAEDDISVERPNYEREALYHQLIDDESAGIAYLSALFEDACRHYQRDAATKLVEQAAQLTDILTDKGRAWGRYFQARLKLIYQRDDEGENEFEGLADHASDPVLQAVAGWSLGQIRVSQHRWSDAIKLYRASLDILQRERAPMYGARLMLALGDAYRDLAESSGGPYAQSDQRPDATGRFLRLLQHLPFLIYEGLVRRVGFMPNWFFGTNYQDWIIAYLLMEATRWHRRAENQFRDIADGQGVMEAQLRLGELEHQLGRWSRAQKRYQMLLDREEVTSSRYRKARVQLGRGRAFLDEGNLGQAETALSEAIETFRELEDHGSIGAAAALLGRLYAASGRWNEAVSTYVESARAFEAAEDHLARTRVTWALEDLAQRVLPDEQRQQVDQVVAQVEERHYVTRFPDTLLRWFRRLALWGALPLTYVLTFVLGLALTVSLVIIEGEWRLWRTGAGAQTTIADAPILAVFATLPVFLALWLYRLVYSLMGIAFVHLLGRRLVPIQKDQPSHLVTDATGLKYYDVSEGSGHTRTMAWSDVSLFASVDYCQRRRPIHLISSTLLASSAGTPVIVDAITAGYSYLKRDIARRLGHQEQNLDLAIFNDRWALVSVAISLAFALYSICVVSDVATYVSEVSGQEVTLPLSSMVVSFTLTLLPVFPVVTLWRLVAHRRAVQRATRYPTKASPPWLLWLAAVASTVAAVLWIAFLATIF